MGVVSDGGVHGHIQHLIASARAMAEAGVPVVIHAITDGRDVPPRSALGFLTELQGNLPHGVRIGTVGNDLIFEVTDDGTFSPARIGHGHGTRSMRHRADALKGDIHWKPGTQGGTKVILRFPLPKTPPYPRDAAPGDNHAT